LLAATPGSRAPPRGGLAAPEAGTSLRREAAWGAAKRVARAARGKLRGARPLVSRAAAVRRGGLVNLPKVAVPGSAAARLVRAA